MMKKTVYLLFVYSSLSFSQLQELQNMHYSSIWDYEIQDRAAKAKLFEHDCFLRKEENNKIPQKAPTTLRITTYNVRAWTNCFSQNTFSAIYNNIRSIDPDILCFQEAQWNNTIQNSLEAGKYLYHDYCHELSEKILGEFGNLIASKIPYTLIEKGIIPEPQRYNERLQKAEPSSYIKVITHAGAKTITLYCTHLDVYGDSRDSDDTRLIQVNKLIELSKTDTTDLTIIAADCNALRTKDYPSDIFKKIKNNRAHTGFTTNTYALEAFEQAGFVDSFTLNNQTTPGFTSWSGLTIDFVWIKNNTHMPLNIASYVYYDAASDHIPVIVDILP